jgi:SAM-dependent methyltransferase
MTSNDHSVQLGSLAEGRLLRDFFRESGYESENLAAGFGRIGPPTAHRRDLGLLLHQTREPNRLNTLVRWFIVGQAVEGKTARAMIPGEALRLLLKSGLVTIEGDQFVPAVVLLPFDGLLAASDLPPKDNPRPDLVVGITPAARALTQFAVRGKVRSLLDLCCGSGIHALLMAGQSDAVVAADLNPRALAFAQFNARLNGVDNVEYCQGDGFAPVEGRRFDLILSNPPFFLLPSSDLLYRDNPLDLDGFAQKLVRQAPHFLNEGGFFQMIFEWVEIEGQPWQQRLAAWLSESGCDAWLLKHYSQRPIEYCHARIRTTQPAAVEQDVDTLARWTEYYARHNVAAIHGGVIAMRKRSGGKNWIEIEEAPFDNQAPVGELVEAVFDTHDLVVGAGDEVLLELRPRLSPQATLEQVSRASAEGWTAPSMQLRLDDGLQRVSRVDPQVAVFLSECTGKRTLGELIRTLLPSEGPQADQIRAGCIAVMRQLMRRGFLKV